MQDRCTKPPDERRGRFSVQRSLHALMPSINAEELPACHMVIPVWWIRSGIVILPMLIRRCVLWPRVDTLESSAAAA